MSLRERSQLGLGLIGLLGFAIAQPIFDLIGREPVFLHEHAVGWRQLWFLVGLSWALPGLALFSILLAVGALGRRWALAVYAAVGALLFAAMLLPLFRGWHAIPAFGLAALASLGLVWALLRWPKLRGAFAIGAVAPFLFSAAFLLREGVRDAVAPPVDPGELRLQRHGELHSLILVVLDELPLSHLLRSESEFDPEHFPNFRALASDAIWFRNTIAASAYTEYAVPAILCGQLNGKPPTRARYPQNIFTLAGNDYHVIALESLTDLCPDEFEKVDPTSRAHRLDYFLGDCAILWAHRALPASLRRSLPQIDTQWGGFGRASLEGGGRPAKFRSWVDRLRPGFKPVLGAIHQTFPHNPYNHDADVQRYTYRSEEPYRYAGRWIEDELAADQAWMRALLQAQAADKLIGELIEHLKQVGLYDDAVIAVVADHGVSFRGGGFARRPTADTHADIVGVPFLLKLPEQKRAGTVDDRLLSTLDLLPTAAEAAGFSLPVELMGRSFLDPEVPARERAIFLDVDDGDARSDLGAESLAGRAATVERRNELLASGPYAVGGDAALLGRSRAELEAGADSAYELRLQADRLGREFRGEILSREPLAGPVQLAFVRDERIVAVTRTIWEDPRRRGGEFWALLPTGTPPRVYEIGDDGRLRAIRATLRNASFLGRRLGSEEVDGIRSWGLRSEFQRNGLRQRWTGDRARIQVPLRPGESACRLRVDIAESAVERWQLLVNDVLIYDGSDTGTLEFEFEPVDGRVLVDLAAPGAEERGILLRGLWLFED